MIHRKQRYKEDNEDYDNGFVMDLLQTNLIRFSKVEYHESIDEDNWHSCSDHSYWVRSILRTSLLFQWWSTTIAAVLKLSLSIASST